MPPARLTLAPCRTKLARAASILFSSGRYQCRSAVKLWSRRAGKSALAYILFCLSFDRAGLRSVCLCREASSPMRWSQSDDVGSRSNNRRAETDVESSRTNADDRLPLASLGRVQGGDGFVEGRDVADVRPQSSVTHPLDNLTQLGTIGLDNEVDRQAVGGPCLGRPDDGHQCSSGSNHACGPLLDVAADDIEHQIDAADVFQPFVVEVDELLRAEVERLLTVGRASGADDIRASLARELGY